MPNAKERKKKKKLKTLYFSLNAENNLGPKHSSQDK